MQFLSFEWFSWMAGTVAVYWILPRGIRDYTLALATLLFVSVHSPSSALIFCVFSLVTYYGTRTRGDLPAYRVCSVAALIVGVLCYYKIQTSGAPEDLIAEVVIPLGLSYYSFRCLHYLLEQYKGRLAQHTLKDFFLYLFFLPTIVVGPIHRFSDFLIDLKGKRWDSVMLSEGLERIVYGYVKITVLGNYLVSTQLAYLIGNVDSANRPLIFYLDIVRTGLNLYLQFSGFSDIAIGFARLLGYRVIENFDWPYLKANISEFWRSWHISLTSWCRDYVYMTIFSFTRNPALGAIGTMLVIGLWHEISLRYVVWGLYHGAGIVVWQLFQRVKPVFPMIQSVLIHRMLHAVSVLVTVHFVWFSFVIVRQPDFASVLRIYQTVLFSWL